MNKPVVLPERADDLPAIFEIMPEAALQQVWRDLVAQSRHTENPDEQTELLNSICMIGNALIQRRRLSRGNG